MLLCQALRPRADSHTRPVACAIGCAHVVPALCRTKTPPLLISWLYHCGFATRCLRFVPASRLTTQDSLTVAGQAFRAGVVTRRVWIEGFDRFLHFVHFVISSARLCLLLFWRFPNSLSLDGASIIKGPTGEVGEVMIDNDCFHIKHTHWLPQFPPRFVGEIQLQFFATVLNVDLAATVFGF